MVKKITSHVILYSVLEGQEQSVLCTLYMVDSQTFYVDLIIDDQQNYGKIFMR